MPPDSTAQPPSGSWQTEAKLDEWLAAKRAKDFDTADRLRAELKESGIEAEKLRPKGWEQTVFPPSGSAAAEALLDEWVEAKRAGNFQLADEIRDDLRVRGIAADKARPPLRSRGGGGGGPLVREET